MRASASDTSASPHQVTQLLQHCGLGLFHAGTPGISPMHCASLGGEISEAVNIKKPQSVSTTTNAAQPAQWDHIKSLSSNVALNTK